MGCDLVVVRNKSFGVDLGQCFVTVTEEEAKSKAPCKQDFGGTPTRILASVLIQKTALDYSTSVVRFR